MTEKQQQIIDILTAEAKPMTMAQISEIAGQKLFAASATPLVKKGVLSKVEGASPVQYFINLDLDMKQVVLDFLEKTQYSSLENMVKHLGSQAEPAIKELEEQGVLIVHPDFNVYAVKVGE